MSVIIVLIAFSSTVALAFLIAYLWAIKSGQYDDKYTPSIRILFDDKVTTKEDKNKSEENLK
ncbi:MAG: cbb3-type cytochrome oxidase assembly protein CcoS [Chlorobi bacterium]|nr:cbb3-type cytochrome oxidase assembly protein CcoS [Chlorobiota bacterium]